MMENISMTNKEGLGTFYWPDGRVYIGQWKDGKQHGFGKFYQPNSDENKNSSPEMRQSGMLDFFFIGIKILLLKFPFLFIQNNNYLK